MPARDSAGLPGPVDSGLSWRPPPGSEGLGGNQRTTPPLRSLHGRVNSGITPVGGVGNQHNACQGTLLKIQAPSVISALFWDFQTTGHTLMRSPRSGRQLHPTQVTLTLDHNATEDVRERSESKLADDAGRDEEICGGVNRAPERRPAPVDLINYRSGCSIALCD